MFEKEVKWFLLANLVGSGTISDQQAAEINKLLLEKLDPEQCNYSVPCDGVGSRTLLRKAGGYRIVTLQL